MDLTLTRYASPLMTPYQPPHWSLICSCFAIVTRTWRLDAVTPPQRPAAEPFSQRKTWCEFHAATVSTTDA